MAEDLPDGFNSRRTKTPGAGVAALALLLAFCSLAHGGVPVTGSGQSLPLAWDPSISPNVAGYIVYYGADGTNFEYSVDVGTNTSYVVCGLQPGETNCFAVIAYNTHGVESPPSNIISYIVPGLLSVAPKTGHRSPAIIRFPVAPGHTYQLQASVNLQTWSTIWQSTATNNAWTQFQDVEGANLRMRFYRLVWH
jgi:hypothetical protein